MNKENNNLRPLTFKDFTGQKDSVQKIMIAIKSAIKRGKPLGHILISGPAGTGKTTFVQIIANEIDAWVQKSGGLTFEKWQSKEN